MPWRSDDYVSTLDAFVIDGFYRLLGRRRHAPRRALAAAEVKAAEREADLPRYRDNERLLRAPEKMPSPRESRPAFADYTPQGSNLPMRGRASLATSCQPCRNSAPNGQIWTCPNSGR